MSETITLKVWTHLFESLRLKQRTWDIRTEADFDSYTFKAGDLIDYREFNPVLQAYTGRSCDYCINRVWHSKDIPDGTLPLGVVLIEIDSIDPHCIVCGQDNLDQLKEIYDGGQFVCLHCKAGLNTPTAIAARGVMRKDALFDNSQSGHAAAINS